MHDGSLIDVCTDCVLLLANGECDPESQEAVAAGLEKNWPGMHLAIGCGSASCGYCVNGETWFSWQNCDGCSSPLGGDRHHVTVFES